MKRSIVVITLALVGAMFATSPIRAEMPNSPPNDVDVSQWLKKEMRGCFKNGDNETLQQFSYKNGSFERMVNRHFVNNKSIFERHIVFFTGNEPVVEIYFVKKGNDWIRYNRSEHSRLARSLSGPYFNKSDVIPCEK